jgi:hypothetical protein
MASPTTQLETVAAAAEVAAMEHRPTVHKRVGTALDVPKPARGPITQAPTSLLRTIELFDQTYSSYLHRLQLGTVVDAIMFVPAMVFSVYCVPALLFLSYFVLPRRVVAEMVLGRHVLYMPWS